MGAKHFGARITRLEDPALLTGQGRFVDDMNLPGMLHACFVRSPHAHARIRAIDTKTARAMPGVQAVLTADDMPERIATGQIPMLVPSPAIKTPRTQISLAREEVCYVGQTIAVGAAIIPATLGLDALRQLLFPPSSLGGLWVADPVTELLVLVVLAVVFLILARLSLAYLERLAKREGRLTSRHQ